MKGTLGEKLTALRKQKGLTQVEVARLTKTSRSTLGGWETDYRAPSLKDLEKMAKFYGVGLDYFGIVMQDEIMDILARSRRIMSNENIPAETKEELYKEIMRLYLTLADKKGENKQ